MSMHEAALLSDLTEGVPLAVEIAGESVALIRSGDTVFCIQDRCSHGEVPLSEGDVDLDDVTVECYLHGSTFDLRTGVPQCLPATEPVPVYHTKIEGETVLVDLPNQGDHA